MEKRYKNSDHLNTQPLSVHDPKGGKRRKTFSPWLRLIIIASWGTLLASLISYGLIKIGY